MEFPDEATQFEDVTTPRGARVCVSKAFSCGRIEGQGHQIEETLLVAFNDQH